MSPIWPVKEVSLPASGAVSTLSEHSMVGNMSRVCGQSGASGAWPSANQARFFPVVLETDFVVTDFWSYNGGTASGNRDIGLYDKQRNLLLSTGSVAQSGTSTIQTHNVTDTEYPAGLYFIALAHSDTTGTYFRLTTSSIGMDSAGVRAQASALPLPSSFTPSAITSSYWPVFGFTMIGVV